MRKPIYEQLKRWKFPIDKGAGFRLTPSSSKKLGPNRGDLASARALMSPKE